MKEISLQQFKYKIKTVTPQEELWQNRSTSRLRLKRHMRTQKNEEICKEK